MIVAQPAPQFFVVRVPSVYEVESLPDSEHSFGIVLSVDGALRSEPRALDASSDVE